MPRPRGPTVPRALASDVHVELQLVDFVRAKEPYELAMPALKKKIPPMKITLPKPRPTKVVPQITE